MKNQNEKLGQESAFPIGYDTGYDASKGMSKRFYAACMAMQGILSNTNLVDSLTADSRIWVVQRAFILADELLKQENK